VNNRIFGDQNHSLIHVGNLKGKLLVATEEMACTPFARAVVLLLQDDSQGTFGVILNRPANDQLKQHWRQLSGSPEHVASQVVQGGPVGGHVFAIHKFQSLGEVELPGDIFISANADTIQKLYEQSPENYRIFMGIAGWKPTQLNGEIQKGYWHVVDSDPEDIFDDTRWLWERSMFRYGEQLMCDLIGISINQLPLDPSLN